MPARASDEPLIQACRGCALSGEGKAGTLADNTPPGWRASLTHEMKTHLFCPACYTELGRLALAIKAIVKDDRLYFPSLVKMGLTPEGS